MSRLAQEIIFIPAGPISLEERLDHRRIPTAHGKIDVLCYAQACLERCSRFKERLNNFHIPTEYGIGERRREGTAFLPLERCARLEERPDHVHILTRDGTIQWRPSFLLLERCTRFEEHLDHV
eukprot:scaffold5989_cov70-Phaeocystis_antarctica.AAC.3